MISENFKLNMNPNFSTWILQKECKISITGDTLTVSFPDFTDTYKISEKTFTILDNLKKHYQIMLSNNTLTNRKSAEKARRAFIEHLIGTQAKANDDEIKRVIHDDFHVKMEASHADHAKKQSATDKEILKLIRAAGKKIMSVKINAGEITIISPDIVIRKRLSDTVSDRSLFLNSAAAELAARLGGVFDLKTCAMFAGGYRFTGNPQTPGQNNARIVQGWFDEAANPEQVVSADENNIKTQSYDIQMTPAAAKIVKKLVKITESTISETEFKKFLLTYGDIQIIFKSVKK